MEEAENVPCSLEMPSFDERQPRQNLWTPLHPPQEGSPQSTAAPFPVQQEAPGGHFLDADMEEVPCPEQALS